MLGRFSYTAALTLTLVLGVVVSCWATPHEDYLQTVASFKALLANEKKAGRRDAWLDILSAFEKSLSAAPKSSDAPKCMYFIGRTHEELGRRSLNLADHQAALTAFDRMLTAYPQHDWADDSFFRKGLIYLEQIKDIPKARTIFEELLTRYPQGDMAAPAKTHLARLGPNQSLPTATRPQSSPPTNQKTKTPMTRLAGIRCWPSPGYTRVVLDLDRDTSYSHTVMELDDGRRQLVLSLPTTEVAPDVASVRKVNGGILSRVEVATTDTAEVRILLDLQHMDHFRTFTLPTPWRVVVDIFGAGQATKAPVQAKTPVSATALDPVQTALRDLQREQAQAPTPRHSAKQPAIPAQTRALPNTSPTPQIKPTPGQKQHTASLVEQLGLTVRTVVIDPGHGGKDPGAVAHGVREKDVNLRMAKILGRLLQAQGFEVHYTRSTDVFISLEERTARANAKNADLFISVHCNAHPKATVKGLEIYYLNLATDAQAVRVAARENGVSAKKISDMQFILSDLMLNSKINESREMASTLQKETVRSMLPKYTVRNLGSKGAFFYVLTGARMPSVLVELGYLTNAVEAANLNQDRYLTAMAQGMVNGIVAYKKKLERYASTTNQKS